MVVQPRKPRRRNGPRQGTVERRREILNAAMRVFAEKGFNAGTLQDIADEVGMTHAGVLHHFGSKKNLLQEVLAHRDAVGGFYEEDEVPDQWSFFRHLIATAKLNATRRGIVQTYTVLCAEAVTESNPGAEYFTDRMDGLRDLIFAHLQGLTPADHPASDSELRAAATTIIALMDGAQVQWLLNPESVDLVDTTVFGINAVLSAVVAGGDQHPIPPAQRAEHSHAEPTAVGPPPQRR